MTKTTTEHNEYGIEHADKTITWLKPEQGGQSIVISVIPGTWRHLTNRDGEVNERDIRQANAEFIAAARQAEQELHLPVGIIESDVIVRRSVVTVYDEPEAVSS